MNDGKQLMLKNGENLKRTRKSFDFLLLFNGYSKYSPTSIQWNAHNYTLLFNTDR